MSYKHLQQQQLEQWKEKQRRLGVNSQYSRHQQRLIEDAYSGREQYSSQQSSQHSFATAREAPNVELQDLKQEVPKQEVQETDVQVSEIQKVEVEKQHREENKIKQAPEKVQTKNIKSE